MFLCLLAQLHERWHALLALLLSWQEHGCRYLAFEYTTLGEKFPFLANFNFLASHGHDDFLFESLENCYADPQAFKSSQTGSKLPGMWTTLLGVLSLGRSNTYLEKSMLLALRW